MVHIQPPSPRAPAWNGKLPHTALCWEITEYCLSQLPGLDWYFHPYFNTPHHSCLKAFLLIYSHSYFHYLIVLSQQNQKKVNKSLSRRTVFITVFIILCQWLKCLLPQCITNEARTQGISSSLHMPDKVLNFVKDHFLMDSMIRSQPLLLKRNARYTQIAVHQVQRANKAYHVLFIGTGKPPHSHNHTNNFLMIVWNVSLSNSHRLITKQWNYTTF